MSDPSKTSTPPSAIDWIGAIHSAVDALPPGPTLMTEREALLHAALTRAIEQLEGWIAWKCPKQHLYDHQRFIGALVRVRDNSGVPS